MFQFAFTQASDVDYSFTTVITRTYQRTDTCFIFLLLKTQI